MNALFMIEGGKPLEMIKQHIEDRANAWNEVCKLAKELGVFDVKTDKTNGVLRAVTFSRESHPEFTKPKVRGGACYPKKGTSWETRFKAQMGYEDPARSISEMFGVPLQISYKGNGCEGSACIGNPLNECGFLYLGKEGPYAMWVPDVPAYVAQHVGNGYTVEEPAASYKLEFDGCRRVEQEEWEILVLQNKLAEKMKLAA